VTCSSQKTKAEVSTCNCISQQKQPTYPEWPGVCLYFRKHTVSLKILKDLEPEAILFSLSPLPVCRVQMVRSYKHTKS
jgi:hypothetical protein